jgi:hypothetical protein
MKLAGWGSGVETRDGMVGNMPATFPSNYVSPADDGRSRH